MEEQKDWNRINRELLARCQRGDEEALAEFVEGNRGLVRWTLRRYRQLPLGMDAEDLEQLGLLALLEAARRPGVQRQPYLGKYLSYCIRKKLYLGIWQEGYLVPLPRRQHEQAVRARRLEGERLVRGEPEEWAARRMGLSAGEYRRRLRQYGQYLAGHASLDAPTGDRTEDDGQPLLAALVDEEGTSPEEEALRRVSCAEVQELLHLLPPRQEQALRCYFGLADGQQHPLAEVGRRCGLSKEGTRLLVRAALETLRLKAAEK